MRWTLIETQSFGGGYNSTLSPGTITLATPLANGALHVLAYFSCMTTSGVWPLCHACSRTHLPNSSPDGLAHEFDQHQIYRDGSDPSISSAAPSYEETALPEAMKLSG